MKRELARMLSFLGALDNPHRLRIVGELAQGRTYVSELARRLGLSRPLLYMHLEKLEKAGIIETSLELSKDGKAMKYIELKPFDVHVNASTIAKTLGRAAPAKEDD